MTNQHYKRIDKCRICGNPNLTEVLNFGEQYLASSFVKSNSDNELSKVRIPLTVVLCDKEKNPNACGLVQLKETVERDLMYCNYFYRSATNPMMRESLKDLVRDLLSRVNIASGDFVLDIGCNDGTTLSYFPADARKIGVDPAKNIVPTPLDSKSTIITDYFSRNRIQKVAGNSLFKAITSIAMFYDLDDPNAFVSEVKSLLAPDGVWCIQLSYLPTSIKTLNFYDVCHEHLEYYTIRVLEHLLNKHNLSIFDASLNDVNGGSLRVFVAHKKNARPASVELKKIYAGEEAMKLMSVQTYRDFAQKIDGLKKKIVYFLYEENKNGGKVIGLGASTKGNVLLQFFGINGNLISHLSERNPEKVGLRTLGTDIELISEESAREMNPTAMLVLIWFFKEELIKREREYLEKGGKLLFPMPYPHIVTKAGEIRL